MANLKDLLVNGVTRFIGKVYAPTPEAGDNSTQVATTAFVMENAGASGYHPTLFDFKYSDKLLNDIQWLRSDTFSWQDGSVYVAAYNKLVEEYNNSASTTVTEGSITFKRTPNGYKIALADQENAILNKYNSNGIAWYYILDTTNKKFKLPRTKFGFEGLRTNVGDDIEAGLPNITGYFEFDSINGQQEYGGAFNGVKVATPYGGTDNPQQNWLNFTFDASRSSSIYGNSDTVQPPATQMYLYFYVGEYTESAVAQTAGLNSELFNGKADVDTPSIQAPYIKDTYVNGTSGYIIWSNGYCEQWGNIPFTATGGWTSGTITFLKPFKDTNYYVNGRGNWSDREFSDFGLNSKTTTNFNVTVAINTLTSENGAWKASGYLALGQY